MHKFFVILIVTWFLLGCEEVSESDRLERSKSYLSKGKESEAIIELKNILRDNGANTEARWMLANIYYKQSLYADAAKEFKQSVRYGFAKSEAYPLLAQSLLQANDTEALNRLDRKVLTPKAAAAVLAAQASASLRNGHYEKAVEAISSAREMDDKSRYVLLVGVKVDIRMRSNDVAKIQASFSELLDLAPDYSEALELLGDYEFGLGHPAKAAEAYTKALKVKPKNSLVRYKRALVDLHANKIGRARQDISRLESSLPDSRGTQLLKGLLAVHDKQYKASVSLLDYAAQDSERYPQALLYLAIAHTNLGNTLLAEEYLYQFLAISPQHSQARKMLAQMKFNQQDYQQAEELIRPVVIASHYDKELSQLLVTSLMRRGKIESAVSLLSTLVDLYPKDTRFKLTLSFALIESQQYDEGLAILDSLSLLKGGAQSTEYLSILASLAQGKPELAIEQAEQQWSNNLKDHNVAAILGYLYMISGRESKAKETLERAWLADTGNAIVGHSLALLAIKSEKPTEARGYYLEILAITPDDLPALIQLSILAEADKDFEGARAYLQRAIESHPQAHLPRVLLARYHLNLEEPDQAQALLDPLMEDQKKLPEVINAAGLIHLQKQQFSKAAIQFRRLEKSFSTSPSLLGQLGLAYLGLGDSKQAADQFSRTLELSPEHFRARIELAKIEFTAGRMDAVGRHLDKLKQSHSGVRQVLELAAQFEASQGNYSEALTLSQLAVKKLPTSDNLLLLVHNHLALGNLPRAHQLLKDWLHSHPADISAGKELANLYLHAGDESGAIEVYQKLLTVDSRNHTARNNLAWLLKDSDQMQALRHARIAVDINTTSAQSLDTLAMVLLRNGDIEQAEHSITRALELDAANPTLRIHGAKIFHKAGKRMLAIKTLKDLLKENASFPERSEAEKVLTELSAS